MSTKHLCEFHRCDKCSPNPWAQILSSLLMMAIIPWMLIWACNAMRPEFAWLPHLTFWKAIALLVLIEAVMPNKMQLRPR